MRDVGCDDLSSSVFVTVDIIPVVIVIVIVIAPVIVIIPVVIVIDIVVYLQKWPSSLSLLNHDYFRCARRLCDRLFRRRRRRRN